MEVNCKNIIRVIIYFLLLIVVFSIIFFIFKNEIKKEQLEKENVGQIGDNTILPTPDRIIYKNQNNEYIVVNSNIDAYSQIYSELYNRITNIVEGKVYSEDEITEMQNKGSFIEFDYNTKSKNFVFMLEENEIGIIKRLSEGGQVIQTSLSNKDKLINKINILTKNISTKYDFNACYNYNSEIKLSEVPNDFKGLQTKVAGVYQKVIEYDENKYITELNKLNFKTDKEIPKINFNKQSLVITVSRYEIKDIKKNIGNIKYELGNFLDQYMVNVFIVSKVTNVKCIYFDVNTSLNNVSEFSVNNTENGVEYYVQNGEYFTNINGNKTEILSIKTAVEIAEKEAKKEKYQYQEWKSDFYCEYNIDYSNSGELIFGLDNISKSCHWRNEWQNKNYDGKVMWKIRLFDKNDPLTNLYVYIDAVNGEVVGAGDASD